MKKRAYTPMRAMSKRRQIPGMRRRSFLPACDRSPIVTDVGCPIFEPSNTIYGKNPNIHRIGIAERLKLPFIPGRARMTGKFIREISRDFELDSIRENYHFKYV